MKKSKNNISGWLEKHGDPNIEIQMEKEFLEKLKEDIKGDKDNLVLKHFDVVRLLDVVFDDDDYYYIFKTQRGIVYSSILVSYIPLKGKIEDKDYNELERLWKLNVF